MYIEFFSRAFKVRKWILIISRLTDQTIRSNQRILNSFQNSPREKTNFVHDTYGFRDFRWNVVGMVSKVKVKSRNLMQVTRSTVWPRIFADKFLFVCLQEKMMNLVLSILKAILFALRYYVTLTSSSFIIELTLVISVLGKWQDRVESSANIVNLKNSDE